MTAAVVPPGANVLLVRHGQSEWNAIGRWQGQADPPLSDDGRRQAKAAGVTIGEWNLDATVTSSDLERARDTAAAIAAGAGLAVTAPDVAFRERTAGEWEGLTRVEIEARYPGWIDDGRRPPGWEPDDAIVDRAVGALGRRVAAAERKMLIVVTHGGLIHSLENATDPASHETGRVANLEGRCFRVGRDRVEAVGERVHLLPPGFDETFGPEA